MQTAIYPEVPDDFGNWLAGFVDGEGTFLITPRHYARRRGGFNLSFRIHLRADDRKILDAIHRTLGVGQVAICPGRGSSEPSADYRVNDKAGLLHVVAVFDRFPLRAKKANDFALWRLAVFHYATIRKGGYRVASWDPIPELCAALKQGRAYCADVPSPGDRRFAPPDTQLSFPAERGASEPGLRGS